MKDKENTKKKREKRKENERKQREIVRMQLNMVAPMDIGMEESGPIGEGSMFSLKKIDKTDAMRRLNRGKMAFVAESKKKDQDSGLGSSGETDDDSDPEEDRLERELDSMYDQYKERKSEADAKYRAKKAREERDDDEWEGLSAEEDQKDDDSSELDEEDDSSDDEDETTPAQSLLTDLDNSKGAGGLSKRATNFFNQDIFKDIAGLIPEDEEEVEEVEDGDEAIDREAEAAFRQQARNKLTKTTAPVEDVAMESDSEAEDEDGFEVVKRVEEEDWEQKDKRRSDGRLGKSRHFTTLNEICS